MGLAIRAREVGGWPGILLPIVACALLMPEAASASCVSHDVPAIPLSTGSSIGLEAADRDATSPTAARAEVPHGPRPCSGEMCSGKPAMPVSPAPPPPLRLEVWAILDLIPPVATFGRAPSLFDEARALPIGVSTSIFHPPRLAPSPVIP